jgi:hypothetical protein
MWRVWAHYSVNECYNCYNREIHLRLERLRVPKEVEIRIKGRSVRCIKKPAWGKGYCLRLEMYVREG